MALPTSAPTYTTLVPNPTDDYFWSIILDSQPNPNRCNLPLSCIPCMQGKNIPVDKCAGIKPQRNARVDKCQRYGYDLIVHCCHQPDKRAKGLQSISTILPPFRILDEKINICLLLRLNLWMQFDFIMDLSFSLIQGVPKKFKIEFLEVWQAWALSGHLGHFLALCTLFDILTT